MYELAKASNVMWVIIYITESYTTHAITWNGATKTILDPDYTNPDIMKFVFEDYDSFVAIVNRLNVSISTPSILTYAQVQVIVPRVRVHKKKGII